MIGTKPPAEQGSSSCSRAARPTRASAATPVFDAVGAKTVALATAGRGSA